MVCIKASRQQHNLRTLWECITRPHCWHHAGPYRGASLRQPLPGYTWQLYSCCRCIHAEIREEQDEQSTGL